MKFFKAVSMLSLSLAFALGAPIRSFAVLPGPTAIDPSVLQNIGPNIVAAIVTPDLKIKLLPSPSPVATGGILTLSMVAEYNNNGADPDPLANDAVVKYSSSTAKLRYISSSVELPFISPLCLWTQSVVDGSPPVDHLECNLGKMTANTTALITARFQVLAASPSTYDVTASIASDGLTELLANNSSTATLNIGTPPPLPPPVAIDPGDGTTGGDSATGGTPEPGAVTDDTAEASKTATATPPAAASGGCSLLR